MNEDDAALLGSANLSGAPFIVGIAEQEIGPAEFLQIKRGAMPYINRKVLDLGASLGHKVFFGIAGEDMPKFVFAYRAAQSYGPESFVAASLHYDLRFEHPDKRKEQIMEFEFRSGFINNIPESLLRQPPSNVRE